VIFVISLIRGFPAETIQRLLSFSTLHLTLFVGFIRFIIIFRCLVVYFTVPSALPSRPVAVATVHVTATSVHLIWASGDSGPPDPTTTYSISYREVDSGPAAVAREVSSVRTTEYRITGLSAYTTYLFQVTAVNNVGRSLPSDTLHVVTDQLGQFYYHFIRSLRVFSISLSSANLFCILYSVTIHSK